MYGPQPGMWLTIKIGKSGFIIKWKKMQVIQNKKDIGEVRVSIKNIYFRNFQ